MNLPLFIARRMARNESGSFSSTIHRIAVASIAFSLIALMVAFFVLYGFKDTIRSKVYNLSGHLTISKYTLSNSFEENAIDASDSLLNVLISNPNITNVQRFILKAGLLKTEQEVQGVLMKGVGSDFDRVRFQSQMVEGVFPEFNTEKPSNEVVISQRISTLLGLNLGDEVTLFFAQKPPRYRRITVAGIYTTGMEEFDEKIIFSDIAQLQRINGWEANEVGGIEVLLKDEKQMEFMEEELFNSLGFELDVVSAYRQNPQIFEWLKLLDRNVLILLIIIVVVGALGMISMVLILIMERTRMIGMLKALGGSESFIRQIFIYTGLRLIMKGLVVGNIFGLLLCWLQAEYQLIPLDVYNYYMYFVPVSFHWPTLLVLNLTIVFLVGITLFIPARIVSSVRPVQAIRFD